MSSHSGPGARCARAPAGRLSGHLIRLAATGTAALLLGIQGYAQIPAQTQTQTPHQTIINLAHLDHLSQPFQVEGETYRGVWIYAEPGLAETDPYQFRGAPGEGETCVDDVARAAITYLWAAQAGMAGHALDYARQQLDFVLALQAPDGEFYNFVFADGSINRLGITSRKGAGFWAARALWAIGEGMHAFRDSDPAYYAQLKEAFLQGVRPFARDVEASWGTYHEVHGFRSPAWFPGDGADVASILLLGLSAFLELEADEATLQLATRLADGLTEFQYGPPQDYPFQAHPSFARDPLQWHAWGSRQTQALARASRLAGNGSDSWLKSAEAEAGHFFVHLLASQGPIENMQPAVKSGPQIAFGMESIASGFFELHATTGKDIYAELGGLMTGWLTGNNELREQMYDPATGRTYDGLERGVVNRNSGAESTITALLALLQASRSEIALEALEWHWLWKHDDVLLELETGLDFGEPPRVEIDTAASGQLTAILEPGAAVVVEGNLELPGTYRLHALYRNDPWEAAASIALGREQLGSVSTGTAGEAHHRLTDLGTVELPAGTARFIVSHQNGRELRFDALVLRPVLTQKLYGRDGARMLLVKSWSETELQLDASGLVSQALTAIGASEATEIIVRSFDRHAGQQADAALLPAFGFALINFGSSEELPDLHAKTAGNAAPREIGFAFSDGAFHGLQLHGLYSNDAFSDNRNPSKGNFDARSGALGATYPAERAPAANEVVELVGIPFMFPPSDEDANNLALTGQRLEIPAGPYRSIWLLGASEQGNYAMPVTLEYSDGSSEQLELGLSDWCQLPRYGEAIALEFAQRRGAGGAVERITCRIWLQQLQVDPARELSIISLPDRETMHIFAITLEEP